MVSPAIFYALIVEAALVGLLLAVVSLAYHRMAKKYFSLKEAEKHLQDEAEKQANAKIAEAEKKAQAIIAASQDSMAKLTQSLEGSIGEVSQKELAAYQETLNTFASQTGEILQNISKDIKTTMLGQVEVFGNKLIQETQAERTQVLSRIEKEFQVAKQEADEYKKGLFSRVEQNIYEIVQNISKKVIQKSLSVEEHEDLVIQALEEAKRQHVL